MQTPMNLARAITWNMTVPATGNVREQGQTTNDVLEGRTHGQGDGETPNAETGKEGRERNAEEIACVKKQEDQARQAHQPEKNPDELAIDAALFDSSGIVDDVGNTTCYEDEEPTEPDEDQYPQDDTQGIPQVAEQAHYIDEHNLERVENENADEYAEGCPKPHESAGVPMSFVPAVPPSEQPAKESDAATTTMAKVSHFQSTSPRTTVFDQAGSAVAHDRGTNSPRVYISSS